MKEREPRGTQKWSIKLDTFRPHFSYVNRTAEKQHSGGSSTYFIFILKSGFQGISLLAADLPTGQALIQAILVRILNISFKVLYRLTLQKSYKHHCDNVIHNLFFTCPSRLKLLLPLLLENSDDSSDDG